MFNQYFSSVAVIDNGVVPTRVNTAKIQTANYLSTDIRHTDQVGTFQTLWKLQVKEGALKMREWKKQER